MPPPLSLIESITLSLSSLLPIVISICPSIEVPVFRVLSAAVRK
jgi:hypothetical protein